MSAPGRERRLGRGRGVFVAADFTLLDANAPCVRWRWTLPRQSRSQHDLLRGEARAALAAAEPADLVVASYMIGEIEDTERSALAELMWAKTRDTLLIVEPGTPAGYARIIELRAQLIASGAHVAAPCPHDGACPLATARLVSFHPAPAPLAGAQADQGRGAAVRGREIQLCRADARAGRTHPARVLAQPVVSKVEVTAKLCTPDGLVIAKVPRRTKADYARARRWRWGDAVASAKRS